MADAQFEDEHGDVFFSDSPTVNAWFDYWLEEVKGNGIRISTKNNYENQSIFGYFVQNWLFSDRRNGIKGRKTYSLPKNIKRFSRKS